MNGTPDYGSWGGGRFGGGEGLLDAGAGGAAEDVVAVQGCGEGDGGEEVFGEGVGEGAEFGKGEGVELAAGLEAEADGVADDLVGLAEGDALVGEGGGGGHGVEVAGGRC